MPSGKVNPGTYWEDRGDGTLLQVNPNGSTEIVDTTGGNYPTMSPLTTPSGTDVAPPAPVPPAPSKAEPYFEDLGGGKLMQVNPDLITNIVNTEGGNYPKSKSEQVIIPTYTGAATTSTGKKYADIQEAIRNKESLANLQPEVKEVAYIEKEKADNEFDRYYTKVGNGEYILKADLEWIQKFQPDQYNVLMKKGVAAYNADIAGQSLRDYAKQRDEILETNIELPDGNLISKVDAQNIQSDDPDLYKIMTEHGFKSYEKSFNQKYTMLPDKQYVPTVDLNDIRLQDPKGYQIMTSKGYDAYVSYIEETNKSAKADNVEFAKYEIATKAVAPYKNKDGNYDIVKYLKDNPGHEETLLDAGFDKDAVDKASYTSKQEWYQSYWQTLTPWEESKGETATVKGGGIMAAELLIPGVSTARHWGEMSDTGKIIAIGTDVASVLLFFYGGKILGAATKPLTATGKLERIAIKAGKAGVELGDATNLMQRNLTGAPLMIKGGTTTDIRLANAVAKAQTKSLRADYAFLEQLQKIKAVSPQELKILEQKANMKGLRDAIFNVNKATDRVAESWKVVDLTQKSYKITPGKGLTTTELSTRQIEINNRYLQALGNLQKNQGKLQAALEQAGSVLNPRYKMPEPAAEFKGYQMSWGSPGKSPKVHAPDDTINVIDNWLKTGKTPEAQAKDEELFKGIDGWLKRSEEIRKGKEQPHFWETPKQEKVSVAEKAPEEGTETLKLKALYAKPKPIEAPGAPKIIPKIKAAPLTLKGLPLSGVTAKASKDLLSKGMIKPQLVGLTRPNINYRTQTIEEVLSKTQPFIGISNKEWQTVREAIEAGINADTAARLKGATQTDIKTQVKEAIKERVSDITQEKMGQIVDQIEVTRISFNPNVRISTSAQTAIKPATETKRQIRQR